MVLRTQCSENSSNLPLKIDSCQLPKKLPKWFPLISQSAKIMTDLSVTHSIFKWHMDRHVSRVTMTEKQLFDWLGDVFLATALLFRNMKVSQTIITTVCVFISSLWFNIAIINDNESLSIDTSLNYCYHHRGYDSST